MGSDHHQVFLSEQIQKHALYIIYIAFAVAIVKSRYATPPRGPAGSRPTAEGCATQARPLLNGFKRGAARIDIRRKSAGKRETAK